MSVLDIQYQVCTRTNYKQLFQTMAVALALMFLFVGVIRAEIFRAAVLRHGHKIHEEVDIDREKGLMTIYVGKMKDLPPKYKSTINLHDFGSGKVAIKQIDSGECIVMDNDEDFDETMKTVDAYEKYGKIPSLKNSKQVIRYPLTAEELETSAGENIARFCEGYKLYKGVEASQIDRIKDKQVRAKRASSRWSALCWHCSIAIQ